jgi:hypothetical protein
MMARRSQSTERAAPRARPAYLPLFAALHPRQHAAWIHGAREANHAQLRPDQVRRAPNG